MTEMQVQLGKDDKAEALSKDAGVIIDIVGKDLVPEKMEAVLYAIGKELVDPCCPRFVFGMEPKDYLGFAFPDVTSAAINLEKIWEDAVLMNRGNKEDEIDHGLTILGNVWMLLLSTAAHEYHHLHLAKLDREAFDSDKKAADELADEFAEGMVEKLAKRYNIEPPAVSEMGAFFAGKFMELFTGESREEFYVVRERKMLEDKLMYDKNDITLKTFREYVRATMDPELKDEDYDQPVIPINATITKEDGKVETAKAAPAEPLPEPVQEAAAGANETDPLIGTDEVDDIPAEEPGSNFTGSEGEVLVADDDPALHAEALTGVPMAATPQTAAPAPAPTPAAAPAVPAPAAGTVPLPAHIQQQNAQMAAAAVPPAAPAPATPNPLPKINLSVETIQAAMKAIYQACYANIFTKCGWQINSDQAFSNAGAVLDALDISSILEQTGAHGLIHRYETYDANGRTIVEEFKGHLRGLVGRKKGLPQYTLYLNLNGQEAKRVLVPQNPATGSNTAQEARAGHAISWIIDGYRNDNGKWVGKIRDNVYEAC